MFIMAAKLSPRRPKLMMQRTPENTNIAPDALVPRSKKAFIGYCTLFLSSLIFCIGAQFAIPSFVATFAGFETDSPWLTRAVINFKWLLLILPVYLSVMTIVLLINPSVKNETNKIFNVMFLIDLFTLIAIIGLVIYALYLP